MPEPLQRLRAEVEQTWHLLSTDDRKGRRWGVLNWDGKDCKRFALVSVRLVKGRFGSTEFFQMQFRSVRSESGRLLSFRS